MPTLQSISFLLYFATGYEPGFCALPTLACCQVDCPQSLDLDLDSHYVELYLYYLVLLFPSQSYSSCLLACSLSSTKCISRYFRYLSGVSSILPLSSYCPCNLRLLSDHTDQANIIIQGWLFLPNFLVDIHTLSTHTQWTHNTPSTHRQWT